MEAHRGEKVKTLNPRPTHPPSDLPLHNGANATELAFRSPLVVIRLLHHLLHSIPIRESFDNGDAIIVEHPQRVPCNSSVR